MIKTISIEQSSLRTINYFIFKLFGHRQIVIEKIKDNVDVIYQFAETILPLLELSIIIDTQYFAFPYLKIILERQCIGTEVNIVAYSVKNK